LCNRLDPSSVDGMSAKMGLDATKPMTWDADRISVPEEASAWARSFLSGVKPV
jgi:hypothetical protein